MKDGRRDGGNTESKEGLEKRNIRRRKARQERRTKIKWSK